MNEIRNYPSIGLALATRALRNLSEADQENILRQVELLRGFLGLGTEDALTVVSAVSAWVVGTNYDGAGEGGRRGIRRGDG